MHFNVMLVLDKFPTTQDIEEAMLPFCEFECTCEPTPYTQWVDETEMYQADFNEHGNDGESFEEFLNRWVELDKDEHMKLEDGYVYRYTNPNGQWDWYVVGGRWQGQIRLREDSLIPFKLLNSAKVLDAPANGKVAIVGEQDWMSRRNGEPTRGYDGAFKGAISLEKCREAEWENFHRLFVEQMIKITGSSSDRMFDELREKVYAVMQQDQIGWMPACQVARVPTTMGLLDFHFDYDPSVPVDEWLSQQKQRLLSPTRNPLCPFAVIKDGEFIEKQWRVWEGQERETDEQWDARFNEIWDSIKDDQFVVFIDIHS